MQGEAVGYLILAILGFIVGGLLGLYVSEAQTFMPWCWYGLFIAIGAPVCLHGLD
jgi:hypothetical protein